MLSFILNLPYTVIGMALAMISQPTSRIEFRNNFGVFIIHVKSLWWMMGYMRGGRATAIGNMILLGPRIEKGDLEHELIHIEQHNKLPLIFPFLYLLELLRKGYKNNKYEVEAYSRAGNLFKE